MAARLLSEASRVEACLGFDLASRMLFTTIMMDGRRTVTPHVLELNDQEFVVLIPDFEQGALPPGFPMPVETHGYYFVWDQAKARTSARSYVDAVASRYQGTALVVDADLPSSLYRALAQRYQVDLEALPSAYAVTVHELPIDKVVQCFSRSDLDFVRKTRPLIIRLRDAAGLYEAMESLQDGRFSTLDHIMDERGLGAVLTSSPLHVQEMTGMPLAALEEGRVWAYYPRRSSRVYVIARKGFDIPGARPVGDFASVIEALKSLACDTVVGFEEVHLPAHVDRQATEEGVTLRPATGAVRFWQDIRAGANLPYYILASQANVFAMEFCVRTCQQVVERGGSLTEREMARLFDEKVAEYAAVAGLEGRIVPYFWVVQAGERTLYPAIPTDYRIGPGTKAVKMDMGTQVIDHMGLIRACSDLARTAAFTPEAKAAQEILERCILDYIFPAIRPGASGWEVYTAGVQGLKDHEEQLRSLGMLPPGCGGEDYSRDCGHILGRQTPCTLSFVATGKEVLRVGMVGCAEYLWPYRDVSIAIEDSFVLTEQGALNITR